MWLLIICLILIIIGLSTLDLNKGITEIVLMFLAVIVIVCLGIEIIYKIQKPNNFKPLYQIDPKQEYYIILNQGNYDTIQFGELENYIQNDNL